MATAINGTYVFTKDSSAQWTTKNSFLARLEIGIERDTGFFKIGDGVRRWTDLPYTVTAGTRGIIVFVSEDPDNILIYGVDGGFKLPGEYFNATVEYLAGKNKNNTVPVPTRMYHQTIYTIGKDIGDILIDLANLRTLTEGITASVTIDDASSTSTTKTYSVSKIVDTIVQSKLDVKNDLLTNHAAAYDALVSLATYLASDPDLATSLATELGNTVKFNAAQSLTTLQKAQVRTNIDAASVQQVGEPLVLLDIYNTALNAPVGSPFIEREV